MLGWLAGLLVKVLHRFVLSTPVHSLLLSGTDKPANWFFSVATVSHHSQIFIEQRRETPSQILSISWSILMYKMYLTKTV